MSYVKRTYSPQTPKSGSPSQAIEDSKKKTSLLKDGSWIRKEVDEDEPVDRDSNFGKALLSKYKSNDDLDSAEPANIKSPKTPNTPSSSVQALTKRFGASQDDLNKISTLPSSNPTRTTTYSTKSTTSSLKSDDPKITTTATTLTKDSKTTETTTTTTQTINRPTEIKSLTKTGTFTERVFSDVKSTSKGTLFPLPSKPVMTDVKVTTNKGTEAQTLDKLLVETTKTDPLNPDSNGIKSTTTTKTSSSAENELFDALLPKSMQTGYSSPVSTKPPSFTKTEIGSTDNTKSYRSPSVTSSATSTKTITNYNSSSDDFLPVRTSSSNTISSKPSEDYSITTPRKSYSSIPDSYDYTSVTSPTVYTSTSYTDSSRLSDPFDDSLVSKSSIKTVYSAPDRTVQAKDLCSYCRKPMSSDPKMVLDEMKINCHATCFKCEVCNSPLGHLKAGDSMWIYRRTVHCERCFDVTREKWRR